MITNMKNRFFKVHSVKDIIISASILITGVALVVIPEAESAVIGGYILVVIGTILGFLLRSEYKDSQTKERFLRKELLFLAEQKASILTALEKSPNTINLAKEGEGQALRLEIFYSKKAGIALLQLYEYIPHRYIACSEVYEYGLDKVDKLLK